MFIGFTLFFEFMKELCLINSQELFEMEAID